jgi:pantoate--beta-alanine ligase
VRTPDGLAMSSRNRYLSAEERQRAPRIHEALLAAVRRIDGGDRDYGGIEQAGVAALTAAGLRPDYFAVRDAASLAAPQADSLDLVVLTAARLGRARLIDNLRARRR